VVAEDMMNAQNNFMSTCS